ncbi:MAG: TonB-dependent siderophore receptor [Bacteroidota bacterium]
MNQKNKLLLLLLFFTGTAMAQATIKGLVKTSDGQPAEFIKVFIKGTNKGSISDKNGAYLIKNVQPGMHIIVASFVGLETKEHVLDVKEGANLTLDFILKESALELHEVVVSASVTNYTESDPSSSLRLDMPLLEVPQNIQVVTGDVLRDQQIISMSDGVVRNVSGVVRSEHWGDLYANISARGSQVQAFRNGFNVVNSYWGPLTEDMSFVENIEFVKGPAGFMLSSGDPSGLYNVVTKKPTGRSKGEVGFTLGSYDLYRTTLDLDGKLNKKGTLLYRLNLAAQNKKAHRQNEYNDRYVIAPVISWQLDDKTKLTMEYTYQRANMSNVGSFYVFSPNGYATLPVDFTSLPAGTPGTEINDHSMYVNLNHKISKKWNLTAQIGQFLYNQIGTSMWPTSVDSTGKMIRNIGLWDAKSKMTMAQVFINGDFTTGPVRHRFLGGLDVSRKNYLADWGQGFDLDSAGAEFDPNNPNLAGVNGFPDFDRSRPLEERAYAAGSFQDQTYSSLYAQDELGFFDNKLRFTLAGRYTVFSQAYYGADSASHFTPRLGLSANLHKTFAVYALYDQSFLPQTGKLASGKSVQPLTGNNMEIGFKKEWFGGKWVSSLSVYHILKNNELVQDPHSAPALGLSVEMGQKTTQGLEFDLRGTITKGLTVVANYAYTDSKVTKVADGVTAYRVGDVVPGFCKHTANAWIGYEIRKGALNGLGVNLGYTALIDRATYWEVAAVNPQVLKDYFKMDAGLFWKKDKFKITANVFNVLDEYLYSGSYYSWTGAYYWQTEAPRNYRISVNYKF